jgi:GTP-binding protein HflX
LVHATRATQQREKAVLVGLATRSTGRTLVNEYLEELALLADSAGAEVVARIVQERPTINAAYYIGKGKAEEIAYLVEEKEIVSVIFDDDLSTVQVRNLENLVKCKILDRSGLILDIFASRAKTREAKTQVELAQLQYMLPRLTRQWTHLSKQYGGIGTKGPGETQIETDRRAIRTRISHLNEKLHVIARERAVQRKGREQFTRVALVGYTNAGKSTLLNWFSDAGVLVEDRLFATLDSTVRQVTLSPAHRILLSDTVGFIRKLPHHLVASFKSTLDEVREADILLHVVDISHPLFEEQMSVVNETLEELGAAGKPMIIVFNKIDRLVNRNVIGYLTANHPDAVFVSATRGIRMSALRELLVARLDAQVVEQTLTVKAADYRTIALLHETAEILEKSYDGETITIRYRIRKLLADRMARRG